MAIGNPIVGTPVLTANRTNTTVSAPVGATTSDVVVVPMTAGRNPSAAPVTPPAGWNTIGPITHSAAADSYFVNTYIFYRVHDGASSWTFTHLAADTNAVAAAYPGVDLGTILDVAAVTNTTGTGTVTQGTDATVSSMTVAAGARLVGIRGAWDGNPISPPASWTERYDNPVMWFGDRDFTAGGATGTIAIDDGNNNPTTNNRWSIIVAALRPGGAGTTYTKTPADAVGLTDNVSAVLAGTSTQTPADPIGLTDTVTVVRSYAHTITDAVAVTDTGAPFELAVTWTVPDSVGVTDTVAVMQSRSIVVADQIGITDVANREGSSSANPTDPVGATDFLSGTLDRPRAPGDGLGLSDTTVALLDRPRATTDTTSITDQVTVDLVAPGAASTADAVGLTDAVTVTLAKVVTVADFLALTDTVISGGTAQAPSGRILATRLSIPTATGRITIPTATGVIT